MESFVLYDFFLASRNLEFSTVSVYTARLIGFSDSRLTRSRDGLAGVGRFRR